MNDKVALSVDPLEGRDCPATVNLVNGVLTVTGDSGNDSIVVGRGPGTIIVLGQSFAASAVSTVVVTAGAGDDYIEDRSGLPSFLYGGTGNDTIYGYGGDDRIFGGHGNDRLYGGGRNDNIWGGGGDDFVDGGAGTNKVYDGSPARNQSNTALEAEIVRLVNAERGKVGLPPLAVSTALNSAAAMHTLDMVSVGNVYGPGQGMQHTLYGSPRPMLTDRLDAAGYDDWTTSFAYGENIAYGYAGAAEVMAGWMNSPGHRANILSANFADIGVSVMYDNAGRLYFTQNFGRRA